MQKNLLGLSSLQYTGLGVAAYSLVLIAAGHWIVRAAFSLGWVAVPLFAVLGLGLLWLSITTPKEQPVRSIMYAIAAIIFLWGIVEVLQHITEIHVF